jgi:protein-S-isoprenylcysteine O-methyltransferase Ste14
MLKLTIILLISFDLMLVTIFWPAGSFYWLQGWLYMGLLFTFTVINVVYLMKVNPEVIEHRLRIGKGTKKWDKVWFVLFAPVFLAIYVTAGFDAVRFEWSTMTFWLYLPGIFLFVAALIIRTSLEDQTLCEELSGYVEYAERVRYRLIPNVW